jgi:hypothetical protein
MPHPAALALPTEVYRHLDYLNTLATDGDTASRAALADTEILRLTTAWRDLLDQHQPDNRGRCPRCSGWRRRRRYPCSVWATAYRHLLAGPTPSRAGDSRRAPAAGPFASSPPAAI